jgi:hypothetical protein
MINLQVLPRIVIEEISVWRMRARGGEEQLQRPRQAKNDGPSGLKNTQPLSMPHAQCKRSSGRRTRCNKDLHLRSARGCEKPVTAQSSNFPVAVCSCQKSALLNRPRQEYIELVLSLVENIEIRKSKLNRLVRHQNEEGLQ